MYLGFGVSQPYTNIAENEKSSKYKWAGAHESMAGKPQGNHTILTNLYWDLCVSSFLNCDVSYPSVKLEEPISSLCFTIG